MGAVGVERTISNLQQLRVVALSGTYYAPKFFVLCLLCLAYSINGDTLNR